MIDYINISDISCLGDEFCKDFDETTTPFLLGRPSKCPPVMSKAEVISICLLFHLSGFRCFKYFYMFYVQRHMQGEFPKSVSYNRFVELSGGLTAADVCFFENLLYEPVFRHLFCRFHTNPCMP